MKKTLIITSILASLLLLSIPQIHALEHHHISTQTLHRLTHQAQQDTHTLLQKTPPDHKTHAILTTIDQMLTAICPSCYTPWDPVCPILAVEFLIMLLLAIVFMLTIILIPLVIVFINQARITYQNAHEAGCLWALAP